MIRTQPISVAPGIEVSSVWRIPETYPARRRTAIILAHGAGNGMDHPFINHFHESFAERGFLSVKFNFPYREAGRKAPDRLPTLQATFRSVADAVRTDPELAPDALYLAGKSLGGRVASHLAAAGEPCRGLIVLGYPLHTANRPEKLRVDHWPRLTCPLLIVQGSRDTLGDLTALRTHVPCIPGPVTLHVIEGGNHSLQRPAAMKSSPEETWSEAVAVVADWVRVNGRGTG